MLATFPLNEVKTVFDLSWTAWLPVVFAGFAIGLVVLLRWLSRRPKKAPKPPAPKPPPRLTRQTILANTLAQLQELDNLVSADKIALEPAANRLSIIARNYVDQVRLLRSSTMTLEEVRAQAYPDWLKTLMSQCYGYEFSANSGVDIATMRGLIAQTTVEVQQWQ